MQMGHFKNDKYFLYGIESSNYALIDQLPNSNALSKRATYIFDMAKT
jgi:hypothetical protein